MAIGENIKRLREAKGLSQEQLAERVGINQCGIAMYERGTRVPSAILAKDIAKVFNTTVDELVK